MLGVNGIKLVAEIFYDDGTIGVMESPLYRKDIRHGDLFPDREVRSVLSYAFNKILGTFRRNGGGQGLYQIVKNLSSESEQ